MRGGSRPHPRSRYLDDEIVAARMVARMRAASDAGAAAADAASVVGRLLEQSEEFAHLWSRHDVLLQNYEVKRIESPLVGLLRLNFVSTDLTETGHRLMVMTPDDDQTSQKLQELPGMVAGGASGWPRR
ncbi:hypothetical protein AB0M46_27170 [Dactylosporangium sp. NPDC051485]|uniref:MmyB family transcriptional regulator n=1 Tax=Dactylosporangium sp. NPDC051485 TaxID=3154846 RepID=UPI00341585CE